MRYWRLGLCFKRAGLGVTVRHSVQSLYLFRLELTRIDKFVAVERGVLGRGYFCDVAIVGDAATLDAFDIGSNQLFLWRRRHHRFAVLDWTGGGRR